MLVAALKLLPAYAVTPLINLQFIWMVAIGILVFGERPGPEVYSGAGLMILAGAWLVWDQARPRAKVTSAIVTKSSAPMPAE